MKLLACHVENFGKLSDFSMDFSDGLNTIIEENGWGKTTLAAFLKAMLYGLDPKKESGAYDRERGIYRPWQGGTYGGTLDFTVGEKSYRISRTFGKTEKADEFHLYDLATMLESTDYSANLGVELFDLDSASFRRSIYIGQSDCACTPTDSIHAKLGNLAENTNDVNNYESAHGILKDAMNRLTPHRATGSIRKRQQLIAQLDAEIRSFDAAQEGYAGVQQLQQAKQAQKEELLKQREALTQSLEEASRKGTVLEKRAQYQALTAEVQQQEEQCKAYEERFPVGIPEEEDLRTFTGTVRQMAEVDATIRNLCGEDVDAQEYERLYEMFGDNPPDRDTVNVYIEKQRSLAANSEKLTALKEQQQEQQEEFELEPLGDRPSEKMPLMASTVLGVVFIVLAVMMLAGAFGAGAIFPDIPWIRYAPAIGMIATGVCILIAAIFFGVAGRSKKRRKERVDAEIAVWDSRKAKRDAEEKQLQEQISDIQMDISDQEQDIRDFLASWHKEVWQDRFVSALYELSNDLERYGRLCQTQKAQEEAHRTKEKLQIQVDEFADQYQLSLGSDLAAELSDIQTRVTEYRLAKQACERAILKKQQFEAANDMEEMLAETDAGPTIEEIHASIRQVDVSIEEVREAIEHYSRQMDELQQQIDLREEREEELCRSQSLQEEELHSYEIMECTQDYLQKAKERFTARYMEPISGAFRKYYDRLLTNAGEEWQIDANIHFSVREHGQMRQTQMLSAGYQDLVGICMRLALVDAMYEDEKPFLILDDPFVNLDDEKQEAGMQLLGSVAQEYQVVYFTCHTSRVPAGEI